MTFRSLFRGIVLLSLLAASGLPARPASAAKRVIRVAIVSDGQTHLDTVFSHEIEEVMRGDQSADVTVSREKIIFADFTGAGVKTAIDRVLADKEVDLVVAVGPVASYEILKRPSVEKPSIAAYVVDGELFGAKVEANGTTTKKNRTFVVTTDAVKNDLAALAKLSGKKKIAILAGKNVLASIPPLGEWLKAQATTAGLEATIVPVTGEAAAQAVSALPAGIEAVYVSEIDELSPAAVGDLTMALLQKKLPSFSRAGRPHVERGLLATVLQKPDDQQRARRIALDIQRLASGEPLSAFSVTLARQEALVINMATARAIGFNPAFGVLSEAELLNDVKEEPKAGATGGGGRRVSMKTAAEEAISTNLDLMADQRKTEAAGAEVGKARAKLLPSIEANLIFATLDEDRARASLGNNPERYIAGELVGRQVIYAEKAWANMSIQGDIAEAKQAQHEIMKLDIATQAAQAYVNVLRAHMLKKIRVDNLKKTRSNLELARVRSSAGTAGAAEVYRWDNQIANDRRALIAAEAMVNAAEMALNQLVHHALEEPFSTEAQTLGADELMIPPGKIALFTATPQSFALFRQFMVEEAASRVPELVALDKAIVALDRAVSSAQLGLFLPTLGVEARVRHNFAMDGQGDSPLRIPPPLDKALKFPYVGETTWSIGAILSFPVFSGLGDWAELEQREAELAAKLEERAAAAEKIEQRVRTALILASASYQAIQLAQDSAEAAKKGLDIVTNAYAQGSLGILDLLDAQNAVLVSDQLAVGAIYESLLDQINVQRSLGWLAFLATPAEANAFIDRATQYVATHSGATKP